MDAVACNASDSLQLWLFNRTNGLLFTKATEASIHALSAPASKLPCTVWPLTTPPRVDTSYCVADVINHQANPGTTLAVGAKKVGEVSALTPRWELL